MQTEKKKKMSSSEEMLARIQNAVRNVLSPLSLDGRRDVLGAIQLSLDSIVSMPSHTRVRPDASVRQSILRLHLELLGLDDSSLESLSHVLAPLTPRELHNVLEHLRAETKIREVLSSVQQLSSNAHCRLGVVIAIQAYFDTLVSLSLDVADASALESILGVWFPILGLANDEHDDSLQSLVEASVAFSPQDGAKILERLRTEIQQMNQHTDDGNV